MDTNQEQKTPEKDIGAVWVKKASSGAQFLSVILDLNQFGINQKVNLVGFKNKNKKETKHPDFRVFVSNREGSATAAKPAAPAPAVQAQDLDI
jgi:uncharacterized protein (DUF736 family)